MCEVDESFVLLLFALNDELHFSDPDFAAALDGVGPAEALVLEGKSGLVEGELEVDQDLAEVGISLVFESDHGLLLAEFLEEGVDFSHALEVLLAPDQVLNLELVAIAVQSVFQDVLEQALGSLVVVLAPAAALLVLDLL